MTAVTSAPALTRRLLLASRPVSWINTAFPFAAAYFLTVRHIDAALIIGTIFFLVPYNLAMYGINDVFDYESDAANPRKGGLEGALLDRGMHRATLITSVAVCAPFIVALVVLGSPISWLVLAVSLFAVAAYSVPGLRFKEIPFLDSVTSSTHFTSPAVYGAALAGTHITPPLVMLLGAFFLWGIASHAFGAVQDVEPDRAGNIASIATVMGAAWTVRFAIGCWTCAGILMLFSPAPGPYAALLVLPYIALAFPYIRISDTDSGAANRGWRHFIWANYGCGFIATILLIIYAVQGAPA